MLWIPLCAALALAIVISCIVLWLREREWRQSPEYARLLVEVHLERLGELPEFRGLRPIRSYRLVEEDGAPSSKLDVKLVDETGADRGYAIANLDRSDDPILELSTQGPCLTERFQRRYPEKRFSIVWVTPTLSVARDTAGAIVGKIGNYFPPATRENAAAIKRMKPEEARTIARQQLRESARRHRAKSYAEWIELHSGAKKKKKKGKLKDTAPSGNFYTYYADGHDRSPKLEQIDPNTGANGNDFPSGCGATAWTIFIRWHDLLWTPELLRGSADNHSWGPESTWDSYQDRVLMEIHDELQTFEWNDEGTTMDWDFDQGFNYITGDLNHEITGKTQGGDDVQKVYDCIALEGRPVLIKTPGHFCVAAGFLVNLDDDDIEEQWIYVNSGWGEFKWVKSRHLEKYWYLKDIKARSKTSFEETSANGPSTVTTRDPKREPDSAHAELRDRHWIFWRGADGDIHYAYGEMGATPDLANGQKLNVQALDAPGLWTNGTDIYLAYVDTMSKIRLKRWSFEEETWSDIPLPASQHRTSHRPAICGAIGDWLTVAYKDLSGASQIVGTSRDVANPQMWPNSHGSTADTFWWPASNWGSTSGPLLLRKDDKTFMFWSEGYTQWARLGPKDGSGALFRQWTPRRAVVGRISTPVLALSSAYVAYRTYGDRIVVDRITPSYSPGLSGADFIFIGGAIGPTASVYSYDACWLRETCHLEPAITAIETEGGKHPMVTVVWAEKSGAHKLSVRRLSIDTTSGAIDSSGHP